MEQIGILRDRAYRLPQETVLLGRIRESGYAPCLLEPAEVQADSLSRILEQKPLRGLIRWEENGGLYGELTAYRKLTRRLVESRVAPLTVDFAFWDHYDGFLLDCLDAAGQSSIHADWPALPDSIDYEAVSGRAGEVIREIRATYASQRELPARWTGYDVAVFNQSGLRRCRIANTPDANSWNRRIFEALGSRALFKMMPSPALGGFGHPPGARVLPHDHRQPLTQNANLASHARYCLTNNSGVLNEFLVTSIPVVVTGAQNYSGFQVFYEMGYWEDLMEKAEDPGWAPPVRQRERARYAHWTLRHQCLHHEPSELLRNLIEQFHSRMQERIEVALPNTKSVQRKPGRCFLTGSDRRLEDLLPWWFSSLRRFHPREPVVFADFGLSDSARAWCLQRGEVLEMDGGGVFPWHLKPEAIWRCPYETRCWLDLDCQVLAPIDAVFQYAEAGMALTEDWIRGREWEHAHGAMPLATGVVAVSGDCRIVARWRTLASAATLRGDQEALNELLAGNRDGIVVMPRCFQWLRLAGNHPEDARIVHWTGVEGTRYLRTLPNGSPQRPEIDKRQH